MGSDTPPPAGAPAHDLDLHGEAVLGCLAVVQVEGEASLRSRVPAALARGEALVREAFREALAQTGGEAVTSAAQGLLASFDEALDAVRFATALQTVLLDKSWPATLLVRPEAAEERDESGALMFRGLRVRVGIHSGRLSIVEGRVRGPALYHVARVAAAAHGGQVLLSQGAFRRLHDVLPEATSAHGPPPAADPDVPWVVRDLGMHRLTGVDGVQVLLQVLPRGLDGRGFPEPASQGVRRSNLVPDDDFVGRQPDVAALIELCGLGVRLVTVIGPPGSGTSRLCRQLALFRRTDPALVGGVWRAAPTSTTLGDVARSVAEVLSVSLVDAEDPEDAIRRIGHALAARGPALVLVDGLDHRAEAVGRGLQTWLTLAPETSFVVASTTRLKARGEVAYALGPLAMPGDQGAARHADAVRLFAQRARGVSATFALGTGGEVAQVIASVGALPRWIRLLAGTVDRLGVAEQIAILGEGPSPEGIYALAWGVLTEEEQAVLAVCALHQGSFEAEMARPVPGMPVGEADIHDVVDGLDRRGWVRVAPDPSAPDLRRYAVAPGLRAFVVGQTSAAHLMAARTHRDAGLLREGQLWAGEAHQRDRPEVVSRLAIEWSNLTRLVQDGVVPDGRGAELDVAMQGLLLLEAVLSARGPLYVGLQLADAVLDRCDEVLDADPFLQIRVLQLRGELALRANRIQRARQSLQRAEGIVERWSDDEGRGACLQLKGQVLWAEGAIPEAADAFAAAQSAYESQGETMKAEVARAHLGAVSMAAGRYEEAQASLQAAADALVATSDGAQAMEWLALLMGRTGRYDDARTQYREAIARRADHGDTRAESKIRVDLAILDYHLGRLAEADEGLAEATALARRIGDRAAEAHAMGYGGLVSLARGQPVVARARLLSSLAVQRDLGDTGAEGHLTGLLGILHHLLDQPDGARTFYQSALALLDRVRDRRLQALFSGWFAALEAEDGDPEIARGLFEAAEGHHAEGVDPQVGQALEQLRGSIEWMDATLAEAEGDDARAATLRGSVRDRIDGAMARATPLPGEARLALARVERRVRGADDDAT